LALQALAQRTVPDLLDRSRRLGTDRPILITTEPQATLLYGDFLDRVAGAALVLARRFPPGSRIGCMFGNGVDYLILRYALACAGLVEVAINGQHKDLVLRHMITISNPAAIVVADAFHQNLEGCGYDLDGTELISEAELAAIVSARTDWEDRPRPEIRAGDACRILFTSGTSGWSKAVELSHGYEVYTGQRHVALLDIGVDDRFLYVTPMFHIDAIYIFSILLHTGGAFALAPRFSASRFWDHVQTTRASYLCYVGAILPILLKGKDAPQGHTLRFAVGGGSTKEQLEAFEQRFNVTVLEAFAMTECIACTFSTVSNRRLGSVGRPVPGYEVTVRDRDDRACGPGVPGEIAVRAGESSGLFTGYLGDAGATAQAMRGGWFHTGDLGMADADGYFYYLGRLKDAIRVRGENVSAMELEAIAETHPDVAASAAVPVPSELGDDEILLYVELRPERAPKANALFDHIAARASKFMVPRYIRFVDTLPRTATEKVQKAELPRTVDAACLSREGP
jgi:carnitine-CoA ligase